MTESELITLLLDKDNSIHALVLSWLNQSLEELNQKRSEEK
jgi:hypothetical protein